MSGHIAMIRKNLELGEALPDRHRYEICSILAQIEAGEFRRAKSAPVHRPDMRAGRNEQGRLMVEYCNAMSAHLSDLAKANHLLRELSNYQSIAWLRERTLTEPPLGRHAILWHMLKAYDHVPCVRTITRKLDK